ncbi:hypothetical protein [Streptomyces sp. NPDC057702]|uniref:hypothetical protein n=1 Tax=unclassified Streptomyces TaxID=2593676 RepID=UPI003692EFF0
MTAPAPRAPASCGRAAVVFEGFRALYAGPYSAYARIHLDRHQAADAVRRTFGTLVRRWPGVVGCHSPATVAWEHLVAHTGSRHQPLPLGARSPLEYDTVVLHHILGYSVARTGDVTGHHPSKIDYLARAWSPALAAECPTLPRASPALPAPVARPARP